MYKMTIITRSGEHHHEHVNLADMINEILSHGLRIVSMQIEHEVNDSTGNFIYEVFVTVH